MKVEPARLLAATKCAISKREGRRYVESRIVRVNGYIIENAEELDIKPGDILKVGNSRPEIEITEELIKSL